MPSSLPSPYVAEIQNLTNSPVPDSVHMPPEHHLSQNSMVASIQSEEDALAPDDAATAADSDNVSFLRALSISDGENHPANNEDIANGSENRYRPTDGTSGGSERQTTIRSTEDNSVNESTRLRRLHSRAREIRVEDRALRDRLQRILHRLDHARDYANADRGHAAQEDYESSWDVTSWNRNGRVAFDRYAYGHPSRRNRRENNARTNIAGGNNTEDAELERIAREFSLGYTDSVSRHPEESTRDGASPRGHSRRGYLRNVDNGNGQWVRYSRDEQERERHNTGQDEVRRNRRLPSNSQEHNIELPQSGRLTLPAPIPTSAASTRSSIAPMIRSVIV